MDLTREKDDVLQGTTGNRQKAKEQKRWKDEICRPFWGIGKEKKWEW